MNSKLSYKVTSDACSQKFEVSYFIFPGGEISIQLAQGNTYHGVPHTIDIQAQIMDSEGLIAMLMLKDALERDFPSVDDYRLDLGCIPYARQDRKCNDGEAFSLKVFASVINSMNFSFVSVVDPHSDVAPALLSNVKEIYTQADVMTNSLAIQALLSGNTILVSPDAGATKKTQAVSKRFGGLEIIQATKERDLKTGVITGFNYYGDVDGKNLLIVDDICDGGGTFMGLANKLAEDGANQISLYVTHGIFSKGVDMLFKNNIDHIYTTNTIPHRYTHENLTIIQL